MITNEVVQKSIGRVDLHHVQGTKTVICSLVLTNGHVVVGEAHCAYDTEFDSELGVEYARKDAEAKVKVLLAFQVRGPINITWN